MIIHEKAPGNGRFMDDENMQCPFFYRFWI